MLVFLMYTTYSFMDKFCLRSSASKIRPNKIDNSARNIKIAAADEQINKPSLPSTQYVNARNTKIQNFQFHALPVDFNL